VRNLVGLIVDEVLLIQKLVVEVAQSLGRYCGMS
jgi:hypothetical protein